MRLQGGCDVLTNTPICRSISSSDPDSTAGLGVLLRFRKDGSPVNCRKLSIYSVSVNVGPRISGRPDSIFYARSAPPVNVVTGLNPFPLGQLETGYLGVAHPNLVSGVPLWIAGRRTTLKLG